MVSVCECECVCVCVSATSHNHAYRNFKYSEVHVDGARVIAEACQQAGVQRLIHFSALNADTSSPSRFLQSKVQSSGGRGGVYVFLHSDPRHMARRL